MEEKHVTTLDSISSKITFEQVAVKVDDHEMRLRITEEQVKQLQNNALKLENVVMSENRETRQTITNTNKQLMDLMNNMMGYKTGQNTLDHNLKITRIEQIAKIVGILAGSGGLLYYIFS